MALVVLDSTNIQAVLDDALNVEKQPKLDLRGDDDKPEDETIAVEPEVDDDDEGEDGTTAREKRELSAKMLKAIAKRHKRAKEAEEFAGATVKELEQAKKTSENLQRQLDELKANVQPAVKSREAAPGRPTRYDFETDDGYFDALAEYKAYEVLEKRDAETARQASEQKIVAEETAMRDRWQRAQSIVDDFDEVTNFTDLIPMPVISYLRTAELAPEFAYYFGKNKNILLSLQKLSPEAQLVQLGKIEDKLTPFGSKPKATAAKNVPKTSDEDTDFAPSKRREVAPVFKPLSSSGTGSQEPDPSEMNTREMIAAYQKQNKVNLATRRRH